MARRNDPAWFLFGAMVMLLFAAAGAAAAAQGCAPANFQPGQSFQRCTDLPVLGASLYWTYHPTNGTADLAFRAPQSTSGWVAWGINTERPSSMAGSSVFIASLDGNGGAVSVLMTYLETTSPTLTNGTLKLDVPVAPVAEYTAGAYTIYVTVALPGNSTQQNTVWQAGALSGGQIAPHPMSGPNMQSTMVLDFLSGGGGTSTGAPSFDVHRHNLRSFGGLKRSPPVMKGYHMRP
ncbi:auxin-induced in root cultures protein 12-like [Miscanthus floridulus]|uniref:auxin-induced in root cultures protein 12-like n=1 Tax=Miscanthus floridulus TaxID=154761 RepID=UPI00345B2C6E